MKSIGTTMRGEAIWNYIEVSISYSVRVKRL